MPDANDNIESRLSAYIDGLLDDKQRQEIEQYLAQYPEHRKLIDDLLRQRSLLRDLPHENAPRDVLEHFQGRLERSVLLDETAQNHGAGAQKSRRPISLIGIAAILLLCLGLAIIIWIALPPKRPNNFAITNNFSAPVEPTTAPNQAPAAPATEPVESSVAAAGQTSANPGTPGTDSQVRSMALDQKQPAAQSMPTMAPRRQTIVIASSDPQKIAEEVVIHLANNSIPFEYLSASSEKISGPTTAASQQAILVRRLTGAQAGQLIGLFSPEQLNQSSATAGSATSQPATEPVEQVIATTSPASFGANGITGAATAPSTTQRAAAAMAAPPTADAGEPVELMILIKKSNPISTTEPIPSTAPTTQIGSQ